MNKVVFLSVTLVAFLVILCPAQSAYAEDPAGKKVFLEKKCNMCHAIESQGIEKKGPAGSKTYPDLSDVGSKRTQEWIVKYLKKEVDIEGKKHTKGWVGKDEELTELTKWLATLKKK